MIYSVILSSYYTLKNELHAVSSTHRDRFPIVHTMRNFKMYWCRSLRGQGVVVARVASLASRARAAAARGALVRRARLRARVGGREYFKQVLDCTLLSYQRGITSLFIVAL